MIETIGKSLITCHACGKTFGVSFVDNRTSGHQVPKSEDALDLVGNMAQYALILHQLRECKRRGIIRPTSLFNNNSSQI